METALVIDSVQPGIKAAGPGEEEFVFLAGRPPMGEFFGFVAQHLGPGVPVDLGSLSEEWRAANDRILELEQSEAGFADNPNVLPLPPDLGPLEERLRADPVFQRTFCVVPSEVRMVELDRLVVFQKYINLGYVRQLIGRLGLTPDPERLFRFCLPFDQPRPPARVGRSGQNVFVFTSASTDLRFLEAVLLDPSQVKGFTPPGVACGIIGLVVGFGANLFSAISTDGRLVLNNGSHRAFALREAGVTHAPCLIQRVSRREELHVIASDELANNQDRYLKGPRPPVLKDYFDPRLRKIVAVPRRHRQVKVPFAVEALDVPAA